MAKSFAEIKRSNRKAVHAAFSLAATIEGDAISEPVALGVRLHTKEAVVGDMDSAGYGQVLTNIDRVIFDTEELSALGLTPAHGDKVTITEPSYNGAYVHLEAMLPGDGPIKQQWLVRDDSD